MLGTEKLLAQQDVTIRDQELSSQKFLFRVLLVFSFAVLLGSMLAIIIFILTRKNEKLKEENLRSKLEQTSAEVKIYSLRSQINPHFIFNCLNSINRFILANETDAASDYLIQFSRLIRRVLIQSKQEWILLKDEVDTLKLYLGMEALRFQNAFNYDFSFDSAIDQSSILIPPMLLQPFLENAIWHGIMQKSTKGNLSIQFSICEKYLFCVIEDDGVGRIFAAQTSIRQGYQSMGTSITQQRLDLINGKTDPSTVGLQIVDLKDKDNNPSGTRVELRIRLNYISTVSSSLNTRDNSLAYD